MQSLRILLILIFTSQGHAALRPDLTHYREIVGARARLADCERLAQQFETTYPNSVYVDDALFLRGQCNFDAKKFSHARKYWGQLLRRFPHSDRARSARLGQGLAFLNSNQKSRALDFLRSVIRRYPKSQEAEKAKLLLKLHSTN